MQPIPPYELHAADNTASFKDNYRKKCAWILCVCLSISLWIVVTVAFNAPKRSFSVHSNYSVKTGESYVCKLFTGPSEDLHIIKFETQPSNILHHILIYSCSLSQEYQGEFECWEPPKECTTLIYAWAVGNQDLLLPSNVGFRPRSNRYLVQFHYYNPGAPFVDESVVSLHYTTVFRTYSAGIIEFAVAQERLSLPPKQATVAVTSVCNISASLAWFSSIHVFGSQLHAHQLGRVIFSELSRAKQRIAYLGRTDAYDFTMQSFQAIVPPVEVHFPDIITTTCIYDTRGKSVETKGGWGTADEMCSNYLMYYPEIVPTPSCVN